MNSRRLAALMFTDIVGYSAIAHKDELLARVLVDQQRKIIRESLATFGGTEHDTAGDGFFIEFSSAVQAVACAMQIQSRLFDRNRSASQERQLQIRIGIHLGDIVSHEEDVFGNGVNLAARIEPFADPGGVCVSQQIYDQVHGKISGLEFKKVGFKKLKNIASGAVVYSIVTPWNKAEKKKLSMTKRKILNLPLFENINSVVGIGLFAACLVCLFASTLRSLTYTAQPSFVRAARLPASVEKNERVDLSNDWDYKLDTATGVWTKFDPKNSWRYSEEIRGHFSLRHKFSSSLQFATPAIVLGLISGPHRVYLNNHFIGGSDQASELAFYSFDQKLMANDKPNELMIEIEGPPSLNPGLSVISSVGAFLGEFTEVRAATAANHMKFSVLRNIYFSISIFIFAIVFAYAVFRRASRSYFYFAFVLLLGSIQLSYFNPLMTEAFNYPFLRFMRVLGLSLVPMMFVSAYLASLTKNQKDRRSELFNNLVAATFACGLALVFFWISKDTNQFGRNFNLALLVAATYNLLGLGYFVVEAVRAARSKAATKVEFGRAVFYFAFLALNLFALISTLKRGIFSDLLSPSLHEFGAQVTLVLPFLFAVAVMVIAAFDYIKQSHAAREKMHRDDFAHEILHVIHEAPTSSLAIQSAHSRLGEFLRVTRSTLYAVSPGPTGPSLEILNSIGRQLANGELNSATVKSHRILSHVLETETPVFIRDVRTDRRFFEPQVESADQSSSYRTGSCIVIPLRSMGQCVGLVTFADKKDHSMFTQTDFTSALEVASTLALLIKSRIA